MTPDKFSKYSLYLLLIVCLFIGGLFFLGGRITLDDGTSMPVYTSLFLAFVAIIVGVTLFLTIGTVFYSLIKRFRISPRKGAQTVVGFFVLLFILFVCWFLGNGSLLTLEGYNGIYNTPSWLRITDMFLNTLYILISTAVLLIAGFYVARKIR